jgi:ELWxxDGT repeat protein
MGCGNSMKKLQTLLFTLMMITVSLAGCTDLSNQVDLDGDTVVDADDLCPDTDTGLSVDLDGCADNQLDDDGDLVMNDVDLCPNTPAGAVVDATGCELPDADEDGITDADDLCPDTDVGATVDTNGCADNQLDDDGDLVMNDVDLCPNTPPGITVDATGCELIADADGDGVADADDDCPNTDVGAIVDASGCAEYQLDADEDGVADADDDCPNTDVGAIVDASGCAENQLDDDGDGVMNDVDLCPITVSGAIVDSVGCDRSFDVILQKTNLTNPVKFGESLVLIDADYDNYSCTLILVDITTLTIEEIVIDAFPSPDTYNTNVPVVSGDFFYFTANDQNHGEELWVSDGTLTGTFMIKDINPGSEAGDLRHLTDVNSILYFTADDGVSGLELWKTDGTEIGTAMVKDINSGDGHSNPIRLTNVSNTLYFSATDGAHGEELWKSDGTDIGTKMVKDTCAGSCAAYPWDITPLGNVVFFTVNDGVHGREIWVSDGTSSGTVLLKDINPEGSGVLSNFVPPNDLTAVGNTLYFHADDGNGPELWKTDGTNIGTQMVKDIFDDTTAASGDPGVLKMVAIDNILYFVIQSDGNSASPSYDGCDKELWRTDGTELGTFMVKDIDDGCGMLGGLNGMIAVESDLYFFSNKASTPDKYLWKTDGSDSGTVRYLSLVGLDTPSWSIGTDAFDICSADSNSLFFTYFDSTMNSRYLATYEI